MSATDTAAQRTSPVSLANEDGVKTEDIDIPLCVEDGDEAIAIICERHSRWVRER